MKCLYCDRYLDDVATHLSYWTAFYSTLHTCKAHSPYIVGVNINDYYWLAKHGLMVKVDFTHDTTKLIQYNMVDSAYSRKLKKEYTQLSRDKWCYHHKLEDKILFETNDLLDVNIDNFDFYVSKMMRLRAFA